VPAEPYLVPEATVAAVAACRAAGGRVVAVGTTVVRTLETAAGASGLRAGAGVTRLRIGPGHRLAAVDGLLTGLHEPEASHLDLLGAFIDRPALDRAYAAALASGYLWHEFGDVCLLLPNGSKRRS
jgi:S-adenosylmethionine:tRNA ribosyltransferase-isomerase